MKARMAGRVAKTDQYLKALGVAPGQETSKDMENAPAWQQRDEIAVSQMHGAGQLQKYLARGYPSTTFRRWYDSPWS